MTLTDKLKARLEPDDSIGETARALAIKHQRWAAETFYIQGANFERARLEPLLTVLLEAVEALEELNNILSDAEARRQMDSFTAQPAQAVISKLSRMVGE